jgi:hypothetical protein
VLRKGSFALLPMRAQRLLATFAVGRVAQRIVYTLANACERLLL